MIEQTVCDILEELFHLPDDKTVLQLSQKDVKEWDSIGHVRFVVALEERFKKEIPIEASMTFSSVNEVVKYIKSQCAEN
jgi:acyl carrier protein